MRLAWTIVLVAGLALPAKAQEEQGWSFSGSFNGSSNTDGVVMTAAPVLGYKFNNHFQTYAGVPFYFVNLSSTAMTTSTTPTTSTPSGFVNGIGNAFVGARLAVDSESVNYSSTLELTGPTGDKTHGFSTGRATADWTNRFSHTPGKNAEIGHDKSTDQDEEPAAGHFNGPNFLCKSWGSPHFFTAWHDTHRTFEALRRR